MATLERISNFGAFSGAICRCTAEDQLALVDLYRAQYPEMRPDDFRRGVDETSDANIQFWYAFKSEEGEIRLAMFAWATGVAFVMVRPEDVESAKLRAAFVKLTTEVRKGLAADGLATGDIPEFSFVFPKRISRFAELLERQGIVSHEFGHGCRRMYFTERIEVAHIQ